MELDHIGLNISNREASALFYGEIMGFTLVKTVEMSDNYLHYFRTTDDGVLLELFDYKQKGESNKLSNRIPGLLRHIAFRFEKVEEIQAILERAKAKGVHIRSELKQVEKLCILSALIADPDGCEIELMVRDREGRDRKQTRPRSIDH